MSFYDSVNDENEENFVVHTKRDAGSNGNGGPWQQRYWDVQNNDGPNRGARTSDVSNTASSKKERRSNSKLHQLLVRSPRNCEGQQNNTVSSNGNRKVLASQSKPVLPPLNHKPNATFNCIDRYSPVMTTINGSSYAPSSTSIGTLTTQTTIASFATPFTTPTSRRTPSSTSVYSALTFVDDEEIDFGLVHRDPKRLNGDRDDEESQSVLSIKSPLISKLLRDDLGRVDDENGGNGLDFGSTTNVDQEKKRSRRVKSYEAERNTRDHSMASSACECACSWSMWICLWVVLFALSSSDNESFGIHVWDRIWRVTSTFWIPDGDSGRGRDHVTSIRNQWIAVHVFVLGSLGLMGLTLGKWGNAVIRAYEVAVASSSILHEDECIVEAHPYHLSTRKRGRQDQIRSRSRPRHSKGGPVADENQVLYGSLSSSSFKHQQHDCHDGPYLFIQNEQENRRQADSEKDDCLVLFPHLQWLLIQTIALTILSIVCANTVWYPAGNQDTPPYNYYDLASKLSQDDITAETREVGVKDGYDERGFVSITNPAFWATKAPGTKDSLAPVSPKEKLMTLFSVLSCAMTSLYWVAYIAQRYIQKSQQVHHQRKQQTVVEDGKCVGFDTNRCNFDSHSGEIIFVEDGNINLCHQTPVAKLEDEDDDSAMCVLAPPATLAAKHEESPSSLEEFYERKLQQMGLVDIETFRVLKRKYARRQQKNL